MAGLVALVVAFTLVLGVSLTSAALPASFGTEGSGAGQISGNPQGIAVEQATGDVYVSDTGNNRIDKFGPEGEFILAFGWGVADGTTEALQTCTTTCFAGLPGPGAGQLNGNEGIAVDNSGGASQGDVYVVDRENVRVEKFSPTGAFLLVFGSEGPGPGQFEPLGERPIAVGSTGTVYVGDRNRVQRFTEAGAFESEVALPGTGRTENLAVDSAGDIYRVSGELEGVRKYDSSGTQLGAARDEAGFAEGMAITIGAADRLFLNDFRGGEFGHHILAFAPEGEQTASFDRGTQTQNGQRGIAYSEPAGALYILNQGTVRIVTPPRPGPLLVGGQTAGQILPASAMLGAALNPEGEETTYRFEYGTTSSYGQSSASQLLPASFEDSPVGAAVAGLDPSTIYHFRLVAESECEPVASPAHICVTEGPDEEFATLAPVSINSTSAFDVTATSATLETDINPLGSPTTYRFEYGTTTAYGTATAFASAGSGLVDVPRSVQIQGLTPLTIYHYRVTASNAFGTVHGPDVTFATQGAAAALLPDGREWEMVTPPQKFGSPLEPITEEGGLIQAAADGSAFTEVALGPLGPGAQGVRSPTNNQWFSNRGPGGWSTQDITTPRDRISIVHPGFPSEYKFFSEDLSASVVEPEGATPLSPQTTERTPYRREPAGTFAPLVNATNVPPGTEFGGVEPVLGSGQWGNGVEFDFASPDLGHLVLASPRVLARGFKPGFESARNNLYEWHGGTLTLVSVLPDGEPTSEAGLGVQLGQGGVNMRGAISDDGSHVFFEAGAHLYARVNATEPQSALSPSQECLEPTRACTVQLDAINGGVGGPGETQFQAASSDGARVFFTTESRLTEDATAEAGRPDLYMCEITAHGGHPSCALSDLSADTNAGESATVVGGVSALDASGEHVYFAAKGVLTDVPNAAGEHAVPGVCREEEGETTCNFYEYDTAVRQVKLVAVLSSQDSPDWKRSSAERQGVNHLVALTTRSSPNGRYLTFMSQRSLTGYDNRDAHTGERDAEVYIFDSATGTLRCVSCNPTGARPVGVFDPSRDKAFPGLLVDHSRSWEERWIAASVPGWTLTTFNAPPSPAHQSRYLSDSGRLFFNSSDALVPQDTNGVMDVYEYEPPGVGDCTTSSPTYGAASGGCVGLISSGTSPEESAFLDASESGDDVFFLTQSRLSTSDVDNAFDVYDAHACSASSPCTPQPPPPPPACEGDACQQPATPPVDATPGSLTFSGAGNVLQCPKGKVKKQGKCVKKKSKAKKHHKKNKGKKHKNKKGKKGKGSRGHLGGGQK